MYMSSLLKRFSVIQILFFLIYYYAAKVFFYVLCQTHIDWVNVIWMQNWLLIFLFLVNYNFYIFIREREILEYLRMWNGWIIRKIILWEFSNLLSYNQILCSKILTFRIRLEIFISSLDGVIVYGNRPFNFWILNEYKTNSLYALILNLPMIRIFNVKK